MIRRFVVLTVLVLVVGAVVAAANEPARAADSGSSAEAITVLRLSPRNFEPGDMQVFVQVKPHPDNRVLRLVIDTGDYFRSTDIPLDGADAPKSHFLVWRSVPPGAYVFSATVYGSTGIRGQVIRRGADMAPAADVSSLD